jgi:hypothetical protein
MCTVRTAFCVPNFKFVLKPVGTPLLKKTSNPISPDETKILY